MNDRAGVIAKFIFLTLIEQDPNLTDQVLQWRCCESLYMDYFSYALIASEMEEKQLAQRSQHKDEVQKDSHGNPLQRWSLTEAGLSLVQTLRPIIPAGILNYLEHFCAHSSSAHNAILASVEESGQGDYWAIFQWKEDNRPHFEFKLLCPDEKQAQKLCTQWRKHAHHLYAQWIQTLQNVDECPLDSND